MALLCLALVLAHLFFLLKVCRALSSIIRGCLKGTVGESEGDRLAVVDDVVWASYAVTTNLPWLDSCLIRSLTAITLLRFLGVPCTLHIGARKQVDTGEMEAHIWVQSGDGKVVCDGVADLGSYAEFS